MLVPSPGAKPEFLATLEALDHEEDFDRLPSEVTLEGYTRDAWAWKPNPKAWTDLVAVSVDGRNKLPGFINYLKDRQKSAYGRFSPTSLWVVSYIQKKTGSDKELSVRLCFDMGLLNNCPLYKPNKQPSMKPVKPTPSPAAKTNTGAKSGMLGNLLGAQRRTNEHMQHVTKPVAPSVQRPESFQSVQSVPAEERRTVQQVLSEFRQKMETEMLDFDVCGEVVLKVKIVLAEMLKGLTDDDKARISMDVLKYIVYEAAEECNEEWVAHKEPSEFMDECVIAIYKEGHAPEEVLEEINRVELTEDMRGEQRALQEARQRKHASHEAKEDDDRIIQAMRAEQEDMAALNMNKRDRRTIEEIQRDLAAGEEQPSEKRVKQ